MALQKRQFYILYTGIYLFFLKHRTTKNKEANYSYKKWRVFNKGFNWAAFSKQSTFFSFFDRTMFSCQHVN